MIERDCANCQNMSIRKNDNDELYKCLLPYNSFIACSVEGSQDYFELKERPKSTFEKFVDACNVEDGLDANI